MLPPEQPTSTQALAMSATARTLDAARGERDVGVMPIQFLAGLQRNAPTRPSSPSEQNCCEFKELIVTCNVPI